MSKKTRLITVRIDEDLLKEYKKWLIDAGLTMAQHLRTVIEETLKKKDKKR